MDVCETHKPLCCKCCHFFNQSILWRWLSVASELGLQTLNSTCLKKKKNVAPYCAYVYISMMCLLTTTTDNNIDDKDNKNNNNDNVEEQGSISI